MSFKPLDEVFDPTLKLPGPNGKIYNVPESDSEFGLWCVRMFTAVDKLANGDEAPQEMPKLRFEGEEETAIQRKALGEALIDELKADGYGPATINFFVQTVIIYNAQGREIAELFWNAGGDGAVFQKAVADTFRNRAGRRQASTNTGAANTTPRRASTSGTKSRTRK